jgi:glycosyltransferase involved in cell wall biosynthesis
MKILHIVPALFGAPDGTLGGAERYALELARNMSRHTETRLLAFGASDRRERADQLDIRVIGGSRFIRDQRQNPFNLRILPEILWADVIHVHQRHILTATLSALVGRFTGRKVFVTDLGGGGWDISAYVNTDRWFDGHLHISEYSRRIAGHQGLNRARVIYGGVDAARFKPSKAEGGALLFVGRVIPHKGVDVLIAALPEAVELRIVGPESEQDYSRLLRAASVGKRVRFLGAVNDEELPGIYQGAFAIVLPSVYRDCYGRSTQVPELLGQTLLEGMACGLPAIATSVASLPEVVDNGRTGFLVPPNDSPALRRAIEGLAFDRGRAREIGAAAREWVQERFSWETTVARCLAAYAGGE